MTAKPGSLKVYVYRGDPVSFSFSSTLDDAPESVVEAAALAQVRTDTESADVVIEFTITVTGDDDEIVTLSLTPEETTTLDPGEYVWDFQPDPDAETWLKGAVTVEGDVSRAGS
jgi:hypothetical protein